MTRDDLARLCDGLSLRGAQVVVHASLRRLGHIEGGAAAVCAALLDMVGDAGTILMPAFTYTETLADESGGRPAVFHPELPVSGEIGAIAEAFRHVPGVLRSNHPTHSFSAWGRQARQVLSTQRDNNPLGPLKKLNVMQGQVLLLGTSLQSATAIHLAEENARLPYLGRRTALRVNAAGYAERVVLENTPGCSAAFFKLEDELDPSKLRSVPLPDGVARKIPIRYLVQLAATMLENDPYAFICGRSGCASCAAKHEGIDRASSAAG